MLMNRRAFCRRVAAVGGVLVVPPLAQACGTLAERSTPGEAEQVDRATMPTSPTGAPATLTAAPTPSPTSTQPPSTPSPTPAPSATPDPVSGTTVALVRTTDRAAGVRQALALLGHNPVRGRRVLLKPNCNSADPAPGSTHPETLAALVQELQGLGAGAITLADRSGMGSTRTVMERMGILRQADELGYQIVVLDELAADDWVLVDDERHHWAQGFPVPRMLMDAECVAQTCNLKTHRYGGHFTMALKNSVGLVAKAWGGHDYMRELHNSPHQRTMIAEINTAYAPALIVMDGVTAFTSGGPDQGTLADTQVVLAGTDRVAIDAVGVAILRLHGTTPEVSRGTVWEQEQIARAVELGLGVGRTQEIGFATADAESRAYASEIAALL